MSLSWSSLPIIDLTPRLPQLICDFILSNEPPYLNTIFLSFIYNSEFSATVAAAMAVTDAVGVGCDILKTAGGPAGT